MLRIFLDANTLLSGLLFEGNESILLELGGIGLCRLVTNEYVVEETKRTLGRENFGLSSEEIVFLQGYIYRCVDVIDNPSTSDIGEYCDALNDKKDLPILLGCIGSQCDYLVTGDKELLSCKLVSSIKTKKMLKILGI